MLKSIIGVVGTCLVSLNVNAIPSYNLNGGGDIVGINGLTVEGALWDMALHDGSLDSLFNEVGTSAIYGSVFANSAANAVVNFTNLNNPAADAF